MLQKGPASTRVKSSTRSPVRAPLESVMNKTSISLEHFNIENMAQRIIKKHAR
jgi:hypothetical protein